MTGLWLVSYLVLWGIVVVLCLLLIGTLRQLGLLQRQFELGLPQEQGDSSIPALEHDGPAIGSPLMELDADTINGFGTLAPRRNLGTTLLVFMSPMCETCQHLAKPLNALAEDDARTLRLNVIVRGDEQACRAFLSVFPLHMPVVCDRENSITMGFDVHRTPFGLLYDEHGILVRKGVIEGQEDLRALLGEGPVSDTAQAHVFPRLVSSQL